MKINGPNEIRKRADSITQAFKDACERMFTPYNLSIGDVPEGEVWFVKDGKVIGKITDIKESD